MTPLSPFPVRAITLHIFLGPYGVVASNASSSISYPYSLRCRTMYWRHCARVSDPGGRGPRATCARTCSIAFSALRAGRELLEALGEEAQETNKRRNPDKCRIVRRMCPPVSVTCPYGTRCTPGSIVLSREVREGCREGHAAFAAKTQRREEALRRPEMAAPCFSHEILCDSSCLYVFVVA